MSWEAAGDSWSGGAPGRDSGLSGRSRGVPGPPGLPAGFEHGGPWADAVPSAALAAALEHAAGPEGLYPGADTDALVGIARQGGVTDACNAGAVSRRCHQVKQMPGWTLTQPKPGWHLWTTPTGRTYVQEPWRYTA
jgi:hypothetical protein